MILLKVVFFQWLDYNCPIMSANAKGEQPLNNEIDAIFETTYCETKKGRIEMAAHAISACVNQVDLLKQAQQASHEGVGSASRLDTALFSLGYSSVFAPIIIPDSDMTEKTDVDRVLELFNDEEDDESEDLFSPLEKAELALMSITDGVRAVYNLSPRHIHRAIALTRKLR